MTPPYLPRELSYTPARVAPVQPPASAPGAVGAPPGPAAARQAASQAEATTWRPAAPPGDQPTVPAVEAPTRGSTPLHDDDAWDWGGEPYPQQFDRQATDWSSSVASAGSFATDVEAESDWFQQPLSATPGPASLPAEERAARALEGLAERLRTGALALEGRAALDSDEAVLASILAALFARRAR